MRLKKNAAFSGRVFCCEQAIQNLFFHMRQFAHVTPPWTGQVNGQIKSDAAFFDQEDAVRQHQSFRYIMGDQKGGKAFRAPDVFNEPLHFNAGQRVQSTRRFIEGKGLRA